LVSDITCIRYVIGQNKDGPLLGGSVRHFVENLAARSSAPGGGAASAAIAAMVNISTIAVSYD
jgi:glutamate formiminotransferase/formiminotetrahydrofolate cyclodeaminase